MFFRLAFCMSWAALLAGLLLPCAHAADNGADAASRPRIGLVLSGGGARGYAHLGVLQYLEELRVPVDYIAATSMGALIGGLYASGISAQELERRLLHMNLNDIAFDRSERAELPQSQREDDFQYPISIAAGYDDGQLKLATGLVQGNNLLALLQNWTAQLQADISFDLLPIPFRAVATDLGQGTEVILDKGSLPRAMRASMAVPGLFAPYQIDGRILVDGGLVSNLPVQEARGMGADIIIAVNIASPLHDPATLQSPPAVLQQMIGILIQQNVKAQKTLLGEHDILIEPELSGMSFADFARGKDGIKAGWEAAQAQSGRLAELSLSPQQWQAYLTSRHHSVTLPRDIHIDAIEINNTGRIPASYVRSRLNIKEGDVYDADSLNQQLSQLSTNGDFNALTQEMLSKGGRNVLRIDVEEKSWGPQYLLFGLGISNTFDGHGNVNLQIGHRYPWMTQTGLEWRSDLILGNESTSLHSELRQPIYGASGTFGVYMSPYIDIGRRFVDAYLDGSDARASPATQYQIDTGVIGFDFGMPLARLGDLRLGVSYQRTAYTPTYNFTSNSHASQFNDSVSSQPVARARLTIDQLDDPLFPRRGYYIYSELDHGLGQVDERYGAAQLKTLWAFSHERDTVNMALEGAGNLSRNNSGPGFFLGGFQRLSAYAADQFYGNYLLYSRLTYLRNLEDDSLPQLRHPVLGTSLEIGNVWQARAAFGNGPYKKSLNLFLGGNSPIGPLYFGTALGQQGVWNLYLQLGRVF